MRVTVTTLLACTAFALAAVSAVAQEPPPPKPVDYYKSARDLIFSGKLDLAVEQLRAFKESNPTDKDFIEIEAKYGASTFLKLRNVVKWEDNPTADAAAKKLVDEIIDKSIEVNKRLIRDPARVARFVRNLSATPAERDFATDQLKLAGEAVVPVVVSELRSTNDLKVRSAILEALPKLPASTLPGLLASLDGLSDDVKALVLKAIAQRPDVLQLADKAETNFTPYLWYYTGSATPSLKGMANGLLSTLVGDSFSRRSADAELVRLAEPFVRRTAAFGSLDKVGNKVRVWSWDAEKNAVRADDLSASDAEEYYGLRYLRWAVERNPQSDPAQSTFLALATERAVLKAKFGDLSRAAPQVYQLLAAAPSAMLASLLDTAMAENRTALAVGVLRTMGDRGQKDTTTGKSSPYIRALNYPDVRVQFAAAVALLRAPGGAAANESRAKVVQVLTRALAADADGAAEGKVGRAIIADPDAARGERLASNFREIGFAAERYATGRDLLRRLGKAADFDLIVVDRHVTDPTVRDVLSQITGDPNSGRRPVLVVASADKVKPVAVEAMLLRLALLVAATETEEAIVVPEPYAFNPKLPDLDRDAARLKNVEVRDVNIEALAKLRLKRLQRLVDASDLPTNRSLVDHLALRLPQLTYAILAAEYGATETTAPATVKQVSGYTTQLKARPARDNPLADVRDSDTLYRISDQLEISLDAERRKKFDLLQKKVQPEPLGIDPGSTRDAALEQQLAGQVKTFQTAVVVPEVFTPISLEDDVKAALGDPAAMPRSEDEKKMVAKQAAEWLRKIATGEVSGYDAKPAEGALRTALRSDDLAPDAIEALVKLGSGDTQLALVGVATDAGRTVPIRMKAADAAARHVQAFGNLTPGPQADGVVQSAIAEKDVVLQGKLGVLARLLVNVNTDFGGILQKFPVKVPAPPAPKPDAPKAPGDAPAKAGDEPKK